MRYLELLYIHPSINILLQIFLFKWNISKRNIHFRTYSKGKIFPFLAWNVSFQIKYVTLHLFFHKPGFNANPVIWKKTSEFQLETQILNWIYSLFNVFLILFERKKNCKLILMEALDMKFFFLFLNKGPHLGWKGPRPARTSRWSCQKSWIFTAHMAQYSFQISNPEN